MRATSRIVFVVAIVLMGYGYWGAFTSAGNKVYDEMDAFFPFFMMIAGIILFIVFLILFIIMKKKAKK